MKARDLLLVTMQLLGMVGGVLFPQWALHLAPLALYFMMSMLLLSFLRIEPGPLVRMRPKDLVEVAVWTLVKLGLMPLLLWAAARWGLPSYALPVLLLGGVSTGVVAPFLSGLLGANTTRVLQVVVLSSVLVPFTLPAWVKLLMGAEFDIPFTHMVRMLALVIFFPLGIAMALRRWMPMLVQVLSRAQYPISLLLCFLINLGIFAAYAQFLASRPWEVLWALGVACMMASVAPFIAWVCARWAPHALDSLTGSVCLTFVNNVLIVVFSFRFFDPEAPLVAALYMVPFFGMIIPIRRLHGR